MSLGIFGVRQKEGGVRAGRPKGIQLSTTLGSEMGILDYLPVCLDPPVEAPPVDLGHVSGHFKETSVAQQGLANSQ